MIIKKIYKRFIKETLAPQVPVKPQVPAVSPEYQVIPIELRLLIK